MKSATSSLAFFLACSQVHATFIGGAVGGGIESKTVIVGGGGASVSEVCSPEQASGCVTGFSAGVGAGVGIVLRPKGKRRSLERRNLIDGKCIVGVVDKDAGKCAKIDGGDRSFNVQSYTLATSIDTDIDAHYTLPDGSICTDTHHCSSSSTTEITNDKCQGAKTVIFQMPDSAPQSNCQIAIQKVNFQCQKVETISQPTQVTTIETGPGGCAECAAAAPGGFQIGGGGTAGFSAHVGVGAGIGL